MVPTHACSSLTASLSRRRADGTWAAESTGSTVAVPSRGPHRSVIRFDATLPAAVRTGPCRTHRRVHGVPLSGRAFTYRQIHIVRIAGDKSVEHCIPRVDA